jgi:hypothetical protein
MKHEDTTKKFCMHRIFVSVRCVAHSERRSISRAVQTTFSLTQTNAFSKAKRHNVCVRASEIALHFLLRGSLSPRAALAMAALRMPACMV